MRHAAPSHRKDGSQTIDHVRVVLEDHSARVMVLLSADGQLQCKCAAACMFSDHGPSFSVRTVACCVLYTLH